MLVHNKINVLFVLLQMDIMGGSENLVYNIVRKMDRNLFDPSIACFFGSNPLESFRNLEVPLYHIPKTRRFDLSSMQLIDYLVRDHHVDIINAHHFMSFIYSFYGSKIKNKCKLIYTEHSSWEISNLKWRWKQLATPLLRYVDYCVGVGQEVTSSLQQAFRVNETKTCTILNGIDVDEFIDLQPNIKLKKQLGLRDKDIVVGIIANLKKVKNHILLVKAFSNIVRYKKNLKLLIIGSSIAGDSDNTEPEIRNFISKAGLEEHFIFVGYRNDIPDILSVIDIYCLTSLKEGMPLSLIEAMAAGKPTIGTYVEGIRDVIVPDKSGFLVPLGDVQALTGSLQILIDDPQLRQRFGKYGQSLASEYYSFQRCLNEYQNLFLAVMNQQSSLR